MKKIKFLRRLVALLAIAVVSMSVFTGQDLDVTLSNLRRELYHDYKQIDKNNVLALTKILQAEERAGI